MASVEDLEAAGRGMAFELDWTAWNAARADERAQGHDKAADAHEHASRVHGDPKAGLEEGSSAARTARRATEETDAPETALKAAREADDRARLGDPLSASVAHAEAAAAHRAAAVRDRQEAAAPRPSETKERQQVVVDRYQKEREHIQGPDTHPLARRGNEDDKGYRGRLANEIHTKARDAGLNVGNEPGSRYAAAQETMAKIADAEKAGPVTGAEKDDIAINVIAKHQEIDAPRRERVEAVRRAGAPPTKVKKTKPRFVSTE